jgi:hypothetical protein
MLHGLAHERDVERRHGERPLLGLALRHEGERAGERDAAGGPRQEPEERCKEGRLAGAVGPDDRDEVSRRGEERDVLDDEPAAAGDGEAVDDEGVSRALGHQQVRRKPATSTRTLWRIVASYVAAPEPGGPSVSP